MQQCLCLRPDSLVAKSHCAKRRNTTKSEMQSKITIKFPQQFLTQAMVINRVLETPEQNSMSMNTQKGTLPLDSNRKYLSFIFEALEPCMLPTPSAQ